MLQAILRVNATLPVSCGSPTLPVLKQESWSSATALPALKHCAELHASELLDSSSQEEAYWTQDTVVPNNFPKTTRQVHAGTVKSELELIQSQGWKHCTFFYVLLLFSVWGPHLVVLRGQTQVVCSPVKHTAHYYLLQPLQSL